MKIYFASAITGVPAETLRFYEDVVARLEAAGHEVYLPHRDEEFTDWRVYGRDMKEIAAADVIVAEVSHPSTGMGLELGLHPEKRVLALAVHGAKVSPFIEGYLRRRGHPFYRFSTASQAAHIVETLLRSKEEACVTRMS